jgi:hypothetical protein
MDAMKGWKTLGFALLIALGGVVQTFNWASVIPQDKTWSGVAMIAIAAIIAGLRSVTTTPIGKALIAFLVVSLASFLFAGSPTYAADMAVKAPTPFVLGYSGSGWYKGIGTFMEMNDATVAGGNVTAAGGALQACGGYQWANAGGGTFTALQACSAYHNVGGSNVAGAVTSRWSATTEIKFGGPIANILQWLPAGASFPTLPALGSAIGSAHPYIGGGVKLQDAHAVIEDEAKRKIDAKGYLSAGLMQQFCTSATSCVTADTFFHFAPSQDSFVLSGEKQKLGKQYLGGVNVYF